MKVWEGKKPNLEIYTKKDLLENIKNYYYMKDIITSEEELEKDSDLQKIRQHSDLWFEIRKKGENSLQEKLIKKFGYPSNVKIVSGSDLGKLLGLHLKYARKYFKRSMTGLKDSIEEFKLELLGQKKEAGIFGKTAMEWGNLHEDNAVGSLIDFFNEEKEKMEFNVYETGTHVYKPNDGNMIVWSTPDGIFEYKKNGIVQLKGILEVKCAMPFMYSEEKGKYNYWSRDPYDEIVYYYIPQIFAEMYATSSYYGMISFYTITNGSNTFVVNRSKKSDRLMELIVDCCLWKDNFHKNYDGEELDENPFKDCSNYEELLSLLLYFSKNYLSVYKRNKLDMHKFYKKANFDLEKPFFLDKN